MPPRHGFPRGWIDIRTAWRGLPAITIAISMGHARTGRQRGVDDPLPTDSRTAAAQAMREGTQIGIRICTHAARTYGPARLCGVDGDGGYGGTIPRSMA